MADVLLFQLTAPLASWGAPAVGECRPTDRRPTTSALTGLVGAALGVPRVDTRQEALAAYYAFATRTDAGSPRSLRDFHTAQTAGGKFRTRADQLKHHNPRTVLSYRDYLQDISFTVAMIATDDAPFSLDQIEKALREPVFTMFAGRKSCPLSAPPFPLVVDAASLDEAFEAYDEVRKETPAKVAPGGVVAVDDAFLGVLVDPARVARSETRRDVNVSRQPQRFTLRREHVLAA